MAYEIKWTANAIEDFNKVIDYLTINWTIAIATEFEEIVCKKLDVLSRQPEIGIQSGKVKTQ
jgi:plasmid stabilization system protein ParE